MSKKHNKGFFARRGDVRGAASDTNETGGCPDGSCSLNGPENGGIDETGEFADDLFAELISKEPAQVPLMNLVPQKLVLSDRCLQAGKMMGQITTQADLYNRKLEVGGFYLLVAGDESFVYRDFILPSGLPVTEGSITVAEHYDKAARENRARNKQFGTNLKMGAMFHIHPVSIKKGGLYHSTDDDDALDSLVNKMAKTTRRVFEAPFELIQGNIRREYGEDGLVLKGDALADAVVKFVYPNDELFFNLLRQYGFKADPGDFKKNEFLAKLLELIDHQTTEPRSVSFAVSFVFNNAGDDPYVKMKAQETFVLSKRSKDITFEDLPIEVVDKGIEIPDENELLALVKDRVVFPKPYFKARIRRWVNGGWQDVAEEQDFYYNGFSRAGTKFPASKARGAFAAADYAGGGINARLESLVLPPPGVALSGKELEEQERRELSEVLLMGESTGVGRGKKDTFAMPENQTFKISGADAAYTHQEFAQLFVFAIHMYHAEQRHSECKYSTYVDELLTTLGRWSQGYNNNRIINYADKDNIVGLRGAVLEVGPLVPDNTVVVEKMKFNTYRIENMVENVADELSGNKTDDQDTIEFMDKFIGTSSTEERNKLIENYVTLVHNPSQAQDKQPAEGSKK